MGKVIPLGTGFKARRRAERVAAARAKNYDHELRLAQRQFIYLYYKTSQAARAGDVEAQQILEGYNEDPDLRAVIDKYHDLGEIERWPS